MVEPPARTIRPVLEVPGYRIEGEAGRGGWSVVYRATDLASGEHVALKTIAPELAGEEWYRERFRRECEIAARLEHPNLVPVHAIGDGWAAMQWVEGMTLRELAPLEPARAAKIVAQVAAALDLMHARGFVHRDVKPGNVLVGPSDHAYLTDLGLAKEISPDPGLTAEGRWLGTVDFAAPEQIRAQPTHARSDVYSLGCVLGFAVTGSVPYPRPTPEATMHAHLYEPPPRLPPALAALDPVLGRALAKDPNRRFSSAGLLASAALGATGAREPLSRRSIAVAAATVVLVVAGVVAALVVFGDSGDAGDESSIPTEPASVELFDVPLESEGAHEYLGSALGEQEDARLTLTVDVEIDDPPRGHIYEVWLYNGRRDAISLGTAAPDDEGVLLTTLELPGSYDQYAYVDLSLEPEDGDAGHSGRSIARGSLP